jgi:hypothetical protein
MPLREHDHSPQGRPSRPDAPRAPGRTIRATTSNQERWLLTYSDMITLLLVLFIVLFALSRIDQAKFKEFKQSVSHAVLSRTPQGTTKVRSQVDDEGNRGDTGEPPSGDQAGAQLRHCSRKGYLGDVTLTINSSGIGRGARCRLDVLHDELCGALGGRGANCRHVGRCAEGLPERRRGGWLYGQPANHRVGPMSTTGSYRPLERRRLSFG